MFEDAERQYIERARVGRLATVDADGRPHVVPVCFAVVDEYIVTPIDEKPQRVSPAELRRSQNISANPRVALIVDHYTETWEQLGWVQVRGTATQTTSETLHNRGVAALKQKYDQYTDHALEERPLIRIAPGSVQSWGALEQVP